MLSFLIKNDSEDDRELLTEVNKYRSGCPMFILLWVNMIMMKFHFIQTLLTKVMLIITRLNV